MKTLLGCYPNGNPPDPETYTAGVVATLAQYPNFAVKAITDPVSGLPSTHSFLPAIAEIRKSLNKKMEPYWEEQKRLLREEEHRREEAAKPSPEERNRVGKLVIELARSMKSGEFWLKNMEGKNEIT